MRSRILNTLATVAVGTVAGLLLSSALIAIGNH